ncbi:DUF2637 domain-containing protein [Streptomyces luteolus]|uniref:DUF2637 domain-containing protein n=1 Tax=Streptomyces luteolus TaxID=3043615 RepID=A0ABT6T7U9_9ACTN|nr:DUF2637 domain-containing protein [Streptomyces sp. B-S-A12]MDI3423899.1 DUF2637 domain-containing protein [Streptomyces sp. B-S-A12]
MQLTRTHRILIGVVIAGAVVIAAIGFAGSYAAVRELALKKGFGDFSYVFPIGIDAGICVLLALDLLLTWIRIPFPLLRQTAWLLTAATIAFNGAAAWPDPLGVGMHAVIPILFVVAVEAARHAIGRIADITADKHMEGVRLTRWLLSPGPTFLLWRRMKLWELRSYEQVIKLEQERLVYQARLRSRYGRNWRRKAPVESLMPLRLAKYGVPLADTAPAGLAAAGIEPTLLPPAPAQAVPEQRQLAAAQRKSIEAEPLAEPTPADTEPHTEPRAQPHAGGTPEPSPWFQAPPPEQVPYEGGYNPEYDPEYTPGHDPEYNPDFPVPAGPGRTRPLTIPGPRTEAVPEQPEPEPETEAEAEAEAEPEDEPRFDQLEPSPYDLPEDISREEAYFGAFRKYVSEYGDMPNARQLGNYLLDLYGVTGQSGGPLSESTLRPYVREFRGRYQEELDAEHIA